MIKIVHYINQFFAGIGGEEMADHKPEMREGVVGPGQALTAAFGGNATITHTIICGDSFFAENTTDATAAILGFVEQVKPDVFIAGPAFNAGRYGVACGSVAKAVQEKFNIPVVTGMYHENPGAEMFQNDVYVIATKNSATGMRDAAPKMAAFALKLAKGEKIGASINEGYLPNGTRINFFEEKRGSERAVDMLLAKMAGKPFTTEFPMPAFDRVAPAPAIKDLSKARFAIVTSGGIVPKGNPERIESSSASKYGGYEYAD
ncbi:MAG: glycine/betaine/sarcosine/D-proline family reductase selenoprotein B, partial [Defluviitaleaceae bacterium]|nr:glycine/betaine/sarcosine/D-proline family reductase selenoprotein B [Defluviitaleaceae bacterium]